MPYENDVGKLSAVIEGLKEQARSFPRVWRTLELCRTVHALWRGEVPGQAHLTSESAGRRISG